MHIDVPGLVRSECTDASVLIVGSVLGLVSLPIASVGTLEFPGLRQANRFLINIAENYYFTSRASLSWTGYRSVFSARVRRLQHFICRNHRAN